MARPQRRRGFSLFAAAPQLRLQFGEHLLDGFMSGEEGSAADERPQLEDAAGGGDRLPFRATPANLVSGEVLHHHDIARRQAGRENCST
jgi:hypothetical protein